MYSDYVQRKHSTHFMLNVVRYQILAHSYFLLYIKEFSRNSLTIFFLDWFPGWARKYGAEPSSLTPSEDCVELRQSFPGLRVNDDNSGDVIDKIDPTLKNQQLYWSDQECRELNWFICAKRMNIRASLDTGKPALKHLL